MESLLYLAAFIGTIYSADVKSVVQMLSGLSKLNAQLYAWAPKGVRRCDGDWLPIEEAYYAEAQALVLKFLAQTGVHVTLGYNERLPRNHPASRLRLEFPGTKHDHSAPLFIESLPEQHREAEDGTWDQVLDMLGYRVGLNIIDAHTTAFETLSESNVEYIEGKIQDGNIEGEFFESLSTDEMDLRGFWKILN